MAQSFYPTSTTVIDAALRVVGGLDPEGGITPTTTQRNNALEALNFLVTSWQADGLQVWCQKQGTYTLSSAVSSVTIGPGGTINVARPLSIQQAWLRDTVASPNVDTPVRVVGREEYNLLSVKTTTGTPNMIYYDPQYDLPGGNSGTTAKGTIYMWPVPDTSLATQYDLYFIYTRPLQDFSAVGDGLDFPQEWFNAIKWNLTMAIAPEYQVPIMTWDRIVKLAEDTKEAALAWDGEQTSTTFSPATQTNAS